MKTVKVLNTIAAVTGIIWIISVFTLVILMYLKTNNVIISDLVSNTTQIVFGFGWLFAFAAGMIASEKECLIIRNRR